MGLLKKKKPHPVLRSHQPARLKGPGYPGNEDLFQDENQEFIDHPDNHPGQTETEK